MTIINAFLDKTKYKVSDPDSLAIIGRIEADANGFALSSDQKAVLDNGVKNIKSITGGAFSKSLGYTVGGFLPDMWVNFHVSMDYSTGTATKVFNLDSVGGKDGDLVGGTVADTLIMTSGGRAINLTAGKYIDTTYQPDTTQRLVLLQTFSPENNLTGNKTIIGGTVNGSIETGIGGANFRFVRSAQAVVATSTTPVTLSVWDSRAISWDGDDDYAFFRNGASLNSGSSVQAFTASALRIGARAGGADQYVGEIQTIMIFNNRVLTATQISLLTSFIQRG